MNLTNRLKTIAEMVKYRTVADIGTDHGKIPVYMIKKGMCDKAIACDINEGPVSACRNNVLKHGLENEISTRLCDGLKGIGKYECESVIIAGMGGELISKIIDDSFDTVVTLKELILQPMTGIDKLKIYLATKGLKITEEKLVAEKQKIYIVLKVENDEPYSITFRQMFISDMVLKSEKKLLTMYIDKILKKSKDKLKGELSDEERKKYVDLIEFLEVTNENI